MSSAGLARPTTILSAKKATTGMRRAADITVCFRDLYLHLHLHLLYKAQDLPFSILLHNEGTLSRTRQGARQEGLARELDVEPNRELHVLRVMPKSLALHPMSEEELREVAIRHWDQDLLHLYFISHRRVQIDQPDRHILQDLEKQSIISFQSQNHTNNTVEL
jgi:hypothetical protein